MNSEQCGGTPRIVTMGRSYWAIDGVRTDVVRRVYRCDTCGHEHETREIGSEMWKHLKREKKALVRQGVDVFDPESLIVRAANLIKERRRKCGS